MANTYFQFRRVDNFQRDWNKKDCFTVEDMDGTTPNYKFVLASNCSGNIEDCLDADGTLNDSVTILNSLGEQDGLVPLLYTQGINGEATISVNATSVSYELPDGKNNIKGIFLTSVGNGSGYVMAYAINNVALDIIDDTLILNMVGMVWGTHYIGE